MELIELKNRMVGLCTQHFHVKSCGSAESLNNDGELKEYRLKVIVSDPKGEVAERYLAFQRAWRKDCPPELLDKFILEYDLQ